MGLFINGHRLKAAAFSLHQFCGAVRTIFPDLVDDRVVEAVTAFLYLRVAEETFGRRFAAALRSRARETYKFSDWSEIESRIARIEHNIEAFDATSAELDPALMAEEEFTRHVRSVIRSILLEANNPWQDTNIVRHTFPRFENAVVRIQKHLEGIKGQSTFLMRR
ncbi:MAG: hypothetical protein AB8G96_03260 [Phycisphaerales bacterium]